MLQTPVGDVVAQQKASDHAAESHVVDILLLEVEHYESKFDEFDGVTVGLRVVKLERENCMELHRLCSRL